MVRKCMIGPILEIQREMEQMHEKRGKCIRKEKNAYKTRNMHAKRGECIRNEENA